MASISDLMMRVELDVALVSSMSNLIGTVVVDCSNQHTIYGIMSIYTHFPLDQLRTRCRPSFRQRRRDQTQHRTHSERVTQDNRRPNRSVPELNLILIPQGKRYEGLKFVTAEPFRDIAGGILDVRNTSIWIAVDVYINLVVICGFADALLGQPRNGQC